MNYSIVGISRGVVSEIDYILEESSHGSWRESEIDDYANCHDLCKINLNDAWISIEHEHVYICYDDFKILLFKNTFAYILIS